MCNKEAAKRALRILANDGTETAAPIHCTFETYYENFLVSLLDDDDILASRNTAREKLVPGYRYSRNPQACYKPSRLFRLAQRDLLLVSSPSNTMVDDVVECYSASGDITKLGLAILGQHEDEKGHERFVQCVNSSDVNELSKDGIAPLHLCALLNNLDAAIVLIARNANVNVRTPYGETPLHIAAFYGNCSMVELLLQHGANPHLVCVNGETTLFNAASMNHTCVVQLLQAHNVDGDLVRGDAWPPVTVATLHNSVDVVRLLANTIECSSWDEVPVCVKCRETPKGTVYGTVEWDAIELALRLKFKECFFILRHFKKPMFNSKYYGDEILEFLGAEKEEGDTCPVCGMELNGQWLKASKRSAA